MSMRNRHPICVAFFCCLVGLYGLSQAVAASGAQGRYAERRTYDPVQGKWIRVASPTPGTEAGELALAETELAQGKAKKARSRIKKWL